MFSVRRETSYCETQNYLVKTIKLPMFVMMDSLEIPSTVMAFPFNPWLLTDNISKVTQQDLQWHTLLGESVLLMATIKIGQGQLIFLYFKCIFPSPSHYSNNSKTPVSMFIIAGDAWPWLWLLCHALLTINTKAWTEHFNTRKNHYMSPSTINTDLSNQYSF